MCVDSVWGLRARRSLKMESSRSSICHPGSFSSHIVKVGGLVLVHAGFTDHNVEHSDDHVAAELWRKVALKCLSTHPG